jgi:uncharacterized SAM-binding protein YcdF (DUF218 family)
MIAWVVSPLGMACLAGLAAIAAALCALRARDVIARRRYLAIAATLPAVALAMLLVMSLPAVARLLVLPLEREANAAAQPSSSGPYDAIVVLGGAVSPALRDPRSTPDLHHASDRVWRAAQLWHRGIAPRIVVCGGPTPRPEDPERTAEADAIAEFLLALGVPAAAMVLERESRNTRENFTFAAALLGADRQVALVTSATHMPRALQEARRAGLTAHAYPTDFGELYADRARPRALVPDLGALGRSSSALKEWLARLAGR